jgi:ATP-dependent exoDNAse (exonuclease V) beta subunit
MLFKSGEGSFRNILAVTFTNKATDEMKSRIIEELHNLGSGRPSQYLAELTSASSLKETAVRSKAKKMLIDILHDYGSFNISTIDRFFQQTMRAFVREIGMQGGYSIEMDQDAALAEAVDNMLNDLDQPANRQLLEWLLRFAAGKVEEGASWDMRRDIMSLGRELFKENYKALHPDATRQEAVDKNELLLYRNDLRAIIASVEKQARNLGEQGMALMQRYGLQPADFIKKSQSPFLRFARLAGKEMKEPPATFVALADNLEGWYSKTTPPDVKSKIEAAFSGGLNHCLKQVIDLFGNLADYHTARESLRFYYALGILADVGRHIDQWRNDRNMILIADTAELLSRIIDGSETPFIYEKIGTRIDHYMIDEFQDTSRMQWRNFLPLLNDSLARGMSNLVVGDVKQSIYRFRNSDWKLLDEQIDKDFRPDLICRETLEDNWRSAEVIIDFNNRMFEAAPRILQEIYNETLETSSLPKEKKQYFGSKIAEVYAHSRQSTPAPSAGSGGHASIEFMPDDNESSWREKSLRRLPAIIEQLQDAGFRPHDIAILTRTNKECSEAADTLLHYKREHPSDRYCYDIISDDALFVDSSPSVRFLLSTLRHLNAPGSETCRRIAVIAHAFLADASAGDRPLPREFQPHIASELEKLSKYALYEAAEGLIRLFSESFPEGEHVFIQAFLDMILEFSQKENADADRFLRWWEDTGCKRAIATPDDRNAIRILTIHKSKGLGFRAVVIPFCDWEIDHKPSKPVILWRCPASAPFNRIPVVPIRYSRNLASTHFAEAYFEERLQAAIDNLNTMYVAFTRAKESLHVMLPSESKAERIAGLLRAVLETSFSLPPDGASFELGAPSPPRRSDSALQGEAIRMGRLSSVSPRERMKLRLRGRDFLAVDARRMRGNLMHEILSGIITLDNISPAVERYRLQGIIGGPEARQIAAELEARLSSPQVAQWFNGSMKVKTEVEILAQAGEQYRPDRVMTSNGRVIIVDYKFGEQQTPSHRAQVRKYMDLVRQMGRDNVEGYLWYVESDSLERL